MNSFPLVVMTYTGGGAGEEGGEERRWRMPARMCVCTCVHARGKPPSMRCIDYRRRQASMEASKQPRTVQRPRVEVVLRQPPGLVPDHPLAAHVAEDLCVCCKEVFVCACKFVSIRVLNKNIE